MGRSAGTGSPISFRCSACRRAAALSYRWDKEARRRGFKVKLTGRKRRRHSNRGSAKGARSDLYAREYVCEDCGHKGWSNHNDLKRREERDARPSE